MKPISSIIEQMPDSGIKEYFDVNALGEDVLSLGVGEPDFSTADHIRQAAIDALNGAKTKYTDNRGTRELREEVACYLQKFHVTYDPKEEVLITAGASEGIDLALRAILNPGDEVLIIQPSYVSYLPCVEMCHGVPVVVETYEENGFKVQPEDIAKKVTDKTKAIILPYPGNPTGTILRKEDLEKIADIIVEKDLYVLSDEIYGELTYGCDHVSVASIPELRERTILITGFSKAFAMTGWRIGIAAAPCRIMAAMNKIHQYTIMSVGTVNQIAALEALTNPKRDAEIRAMRDSYDARRKVLVDGLRKIGLSVAEPEGAFYVFPNITSTGLSSQEYCDRLLKEQRVAVVPGNGFGACGEGFIRCSYAYDIDAIRECLRRMDAFQEQFR